MKQHSRRDFLKTTAVIGSAAAAGQLGAAAAQTADMAIVRWKGVPVDDAGVSAMARRMTEEAIGKLGGMKRFVEKGNSVWVLPNVAWDRKPEQAANTNPDVVATLVRLCLEAGAKKVKVGCNTCHESKKAYPGSGIEAAAKSAGAEVVYLDKNRYKDYDFGSKLLPKWPLYPKIVESDLVINVPVVKHHCVAKATMCMKNYMGVIGGNRGKWHQEMPTLLTDLTRFMKPQLCVLDAIRILTANGPTGGSLKDVKRMDTLAAGTDIVALDAFGAEILGHSPQDIQSVVAGHRAGLGEMDYRKLNPQEIELA